jgi:hypothetical protein
MGSSNVQYQQVGASEAGVGVSGSVGSTIARDGAISLGQNNTVKSGNDITGVSGNVTIGETNLGKTFADTIKSLTEQNTNALTSFANQKATSALPNAATDLPKVNTTSEDVPKTNWLWYVGGGFVVLIALSLLIRRK